MNPIYAFTPSLIRDLIAIEAARRNMHLTVLLLQVTEHLRRDARLRSTRYWTCIEGDRPVAAQRAKAVTVLVVKMVQRVGFRRNLRYSTVFSTVHLKNA